MAKKQDLTNSYDDDFFETELYADYDLVFKDSKRLNKQQKAKPKRNARRRLEDYFDRKALRNKMEDLNTRSK